ncbi:MAG: HD domain-containing protein [Armatimonadota bacterium]|nr:HD domain-containing protein [Armatimonadota bacterium]MCX7777805.1 HD domain-containing protein [Armatimonadota bacterium]MDW8025919.1 HD domain-containing protein [Armatimonadota bacterium]
MQYDELNTQRTELQEAARQWRKRIFETPLACVSGLELCAEISQSLDELMRRIYEFSFFHAFKVAGEHYQPDRTEVAIVATGSYGRMQLCPFSDVDITFVPSEQDNPFIDAVLKNTFRLLISTIIDAIDLRLGYAYRPLEDIPNLDSVTKAALMDARLVAGSERLYCKLLDSLHGTMDTMAFVQDKIAERSSVRGRSIHLTEPNIKHGAGMLRDIQQTLWLLSAVHSIHPPVTPMKLFELGMLSHEEAKRLQEALDFFLRVRNWLHLRAGKREDTLLREYHEQIACDFGFAEDAKASMNELFERLYGYAEFVNSLARHVEHMVHELQIAIDEHFYAEHQRLHIYDANSLTREPQLLLTAFEHAQRYKLELSHELRNAIKRAVTAFGEVLSHADWCGRKLMNILGHPSPQRIIGEMVELSVLQACIPELGRAMSIVPSNRAHELTVGAHCVRTMLNLAELEQMRDSETLIGEVWKDVSDRSILHLAALLHDLGKVHSEDEEGHCKAGAKLAEDVGSRFRLDHDRRRLLVELVKNHMLLLRAARLHDTQDETILMQLAEKINDAGLLRMLYLLSYADAQAVSGQTFTALEKELLDSLFINLNRYLIAHAEADLQTIVSEHRARLSRRLKQYGLTPQQIEFVLSAFPTGYLLNTTTETIAEHLRMIDRLIETGEPIIAIHNEPGADFSSLEICAYDEPSPGLLSRICGALYAQDVDIRMAQVLTVDITDKFKHGTSDSGKKRVVLDTLLIRTRYGQVSEAKARRIHETLVRVLSKDVSVVQLLEESGLESTFSVNVHSISVSNSVSKVCTVIHIKADDRKGLLFRITGAISSLGLDIVTAKIATWRDVAEDSFYVITRDGTKVPDEELERLKSELRERLEKPWALT